MNLELRSIIGVATIITTLWSLVGIIRSLKLKADKLLGQYTVGAFEWSLVLLASIVISIFVFWPRIVKLWKRITKQDKLDELLALIERDREVFQDLTQYSPQSLVESYFHDAKRRINEMIYILSKLKFTVPSQKDFDHYRFYEYWYSFINRLELIIKNENYKDHLDLWSEDSPFKT